MGQSSIQEEEGAGGAGIIAQSIVQDEQAVIEVVVEKDSSGEPLVVEAVGGAGGTDPQVGQEPGILQCEQQAHVAGGGAQLVLEGEQLPAAGTAGSRQADGCLFSIQH